MPNDDLFTTIMGKHYEGMYPGADPYKKAQMIREKIPSAQQEALQEPAVDPIKATMLGLSGGAGMVMNPSPNMGSMEAKYAINGLFSYLLHQALMKGADKVRNTPVASTNK